MKLNTKSRYAVMAMADLASHGPNDPVSLADIATRQDISLSYLEQLFAKLRRAKLVHSVRGPGGGYQLATKPADICIGDIIHAVDEPIQTTRCAEGSHVGCGGGAGRCLTHDLWAELGRHIHLYLSAVTLADVIDKRVLGSAGFGVPRAEMRALSSAKEAVRVP